MLTSISFRWSIMRIISPMSFLHSGGLLICRDNKTNTLLYRYNYVCSSNIEVIAFGVLLFCSSQLTNIFEVVMSAPVLDNPVGLTYIHVADQSQRYSRNFLYREGYNVADSARLTCL